VVLPGLGRIKLCEDASGRVARVDAGTVRVVSAAAGFQRGRWFVSFTVDIQRPEAALAHPDVVVGVDLGIKTFAAGSTGKKYPDPRRFGGGMRKVGHRHRAWSRRVGPYDNASMTRWDSSNRWCRASAALGEAQRRVAGQRRDGLYKLATALARECGTVVIEDLFVAGMLKNHCFAWRIWDASFGELRRRL
jgi:putative transposase